MCRAQLLKIIIIVIFNDIQINVIMSKILVIVNAYELIDDDSNRACVWMK
ncbi:unknown [Prevotella sp. CAG:617]|nr:unknown [Prevotella sp. CAG:617]